ncbi:MAG TPA: hypothetical protein VGI74_15595 [Streptosporangiaceae bacterium]
MRDPPEGRADGGAVTPAVISPAQIVSGARIARRYLLKSAVFGRPPWNEGGDKDPLASHTVTTGLLAPLPRAVTGVVLDASPQILVIGNGGTEERFALTADASAWRGAKTDPAAIRAGDQAVVRRHNASREVADRIWANIGRVSGTIIERNRDTFLVDCGSRGQQALVMPHTATGKIQVRFPRLEPGYLIDIIGVRRDGYLEGLVPATYQPPYRADHVPAPPLINGHLPVSIQGSAVWHEPGGEPRGLTGLAYPAVDPHSDATTASPAPAGQASGCVSLPYLSIGSLLRVRNDCTEACRVLPVTGSAALATLFCDRSVTCGPSPRGRIADLTLASFVELGGELHEGCFNATIEIEG